jgi:hypothetical protein
MNREIPTSENADAVARFRSWHTEYWRKWVGTCADEMAHNRIEAERQLCNPNPKVRCAALAVLELHWDATKDCGFAKRCEDLAFADSSLEVRRVALRTLGVCHEDTFDLRIGELLARVVLNEAEHEGIRSAAYFGLLHVRGRRPPLCDFGDPPTVFRIPEDVDWLFVKSAIDG